MPVYDRAYIRVKRQKACNFIKKEALAQVLSSEFCEISKDSSLQNTSGRLLLKAVNYFRKKLSIIYVWKDSKCTSAAVSISCIVIKKDVKIKHINANLFKDFSGNTLTWNISLIFIPYNSHKKLRFKIY